VQVVVLGAGVVGVTAAWYLRQAGHQVTVIDRQPGPGLETSFANGGQISASHAEPWANPAIPAKALKWFGRADAPLVLKPRFDPALWAWLGRFLLNCTATRARINTERALRVALYSRIALKELRAETGIRYDQQTRGILHIYRDRAELDHAVLEAEYMTRLGCARRVLTPAECVAVEPALAAARDDLVGGIYSPDDESGDAHKFTVALAALAAGRGVGFRYGVDVRRLVAEGDRLARVETSTGSVTADLFVLSLGSYSPLLLRPLGLRLPVYPAKGYSVSIPIAGHVGAPTVSLTDDEHKLVYSRLGETLRVAGTAEFAGYDTALDETRARTILAKAMALFPDCGEPSGARFWCGLRPKTPDSVPVIGPTRLKNLLLNTGHGTLGWTMACGSGRIVADLASGRRPEIEMTGLGIERFG
jgi:D-amino-acid dehydrogenase